MLSTVVKMIARFYLLTKFNFCSKICDCLSISFNTAVIAPIINEKKMTPANMVRMAMSLSETVSAPMSPYPIVRNVWMTQYKEVKYLTKLEES